MWDSFSETADDNVLLTIFGSLNASDCVNFVATSKCSFARATDVSSDCQTSRTSGSSEGQALLRQLALAFVDDTIVTAVDAAFQKAAPDACSSLYLLRSLRSQSLIAKTFQFAIRLMERIEAGVEDTLEHAETRRHGPYVELKQRHGRVHVQNAEAFLDCLFRAEVDRLKQSCGPDALESIGTNGEARVRFAADIALTTLLRQTFFMSSLTACAMALQDADVRLTSVYDDEFSPKRTTMLWLVGNLQFSFWLIALGNLALMLSFFSRQWTPSMKLCAVWLQRGSSCLAGDLSLELLATIRGCSLPLGLRLESLDTSTVSDLLLIVISCVI